MPFLQEEYVNFAMKGWLGILGTGDRYTSPDNISYFEELFSLDFIIKDYTVWKELYKIPVAGTQAAAIVNAAALPNIIADHATTALRLTPTPNNKVFLACSTYGDTKTRIGNWVMPQLLNHLSAAKGYTIRLFNGDPGAGGLEITTTIGKAPGSTRVGWYVSYASGAIKVSSDFTDIISPTDIWIQGFRYVGKTVENGYWGDPVVSQVVTDPTSISPALGDSYIIPSGSVGVWSTHIDEIAKWVGYWKYFKSTEGMAVYDLNNHSYYSYNLSGNWSVFGGAGGIGFYNDASYLGVVNNIKIIGDRVLGTVSGTVGVVHAPPRDTVLKTRLLVTGSIVTGTVLNVTASGANYTKSLDNGYLETTAVLFNGNKDIYVLLNGIELEKTTDVVWVSSTTFIINLNLDIGDVLLIYS